MTHEEFVQLCRRHESVWQASRAERLALALHVVDCATCQQQLKILGPETPEETAKLDQMSHTQRMDVLGNDLADPEIWKAFNERAEDIRRFVDRAGEDTDS